jgi:hypothetical protein
MQEKRRSGRMRPKHLQQSRSRSSPSRTAGPKRRRPSPAPGPPPPFFTSLYLQGNLGFSPTKAGLAFVPMALCLAVAATLSPRVTAIIGGHRVVAIGMAVMTVGRLLFVRLGATFAGLLQGFVLFGLEAGLMNVPLPTRCSTARPQPRGASRPPC